MPILRENEKTSHKKNYTNNIFHPTNYYNIKATYKLFSESNCYLATTTSGWFNSKTKVLTGSHDEFEDNSPSLCVKNCAGNGFMLAGVENGNGCYCGDDMPDER